MGRGISNIQKYALRQYCMRSKNIEKSILCENVYAVVPLGIKALNEAKISDFSPSAHFICADLDSSLI